MAFPRYLMLLIGYTRPIRPLSHNLLTAKGLATVAPAKRQFHCSQLPSFHVVARPTSFVAGPCRHYVIGTSIDDNGTTKNNNSNAEDDGLSDTNTESADPDTDLIDLSDLANHDKEKSEVVKINELDKTSFRNAASSVLNWSGQKDHTGATDETRSTSSNAWSGDDDLVIYTDQDFLTMRQQKRQTQEDRRSAVVTDDHEQDEQDLQALLRNIQRQQEEQNKVALREKRLSMMTVQELVEFLREENAKDVCVIEVAADMDYVDHFIVCTGMGSRHIGRMADHLVSELKRVRVGRSQRRVRVEGRNCQDWMAVDLGTMVVHFMLEETREKVELEKLWTLGEKYDDQCRAMLKCYQDGMNLT